MSIKRITFASEPLTPSPQSVRATLAHSLGIEAEPRAPFEYVLIEWFESPVSANASDRSLLVREEVKRGADWLEAHRGDRRPKLKHMTVATRAAGLTAEEFSQRWNAHGGTAGGGNAIPDAAKGSAYIQNHPLLSVGVQWPYDAINEVYLADESALRSRIEWFAANEVASRDRDLFGATQYLVLEETEVAL
jgi:hypothetical protein